MKELIGSLLMIAIILGVEMANSSPDPTPCIEDTILDECVNPERSQPRFKLRT